MNRRRLAIGVLVLAVSACAGEPAPSGYGEPVRVPEAVFKEGDLEDIASAVDEEGPRVTAITISANVVRPRQAGLALSGRTSSAAYSVAVRFSDLGTGFWVVPVGAEDLAAPGELGWDITVDLGPDLPSGEHRLEAVALDAGGVAGPPSAVRLCVVQGVDTTRNACDPTVQPPAAAISLSWDDDADLDLVLVTPSGRTVDARNVATVATEKDEPFDRDAPGVGVLQVDSNPGCTTDSIRRESVVWRTAVEPGTYLVYANLFEACGKQAVHFTLEAFVRTEDESGTFGFEQHGESIYGVVLGASANGGYRTGLFVGAIEFP